MYILSLRPPTQLKFDIVACFYPPTAQTTTSTATTTSTPSPTDTPSPTATPSTTGTPPPTTTTLPPTTTTMNYCTEENGMNQPLTIQPNQVTSNQPYDQTTSPADINPTTTSPGINFPSTNPLINITLTQPATLTLIYLPTDRPNQPTNVNEFSVVFVYPNGNLSALFTSEIPSSSGTTSTTTTQSTSTLSGTSTTQTPSDIIPPSNVSPQVDLPPNFQVPNGTVLMIMITSTNDSASPYGVSKDFFFFTVEMQLVMRQLRIKVGKKTSLVI
jgi:hypothetical protein